MINYQGLSNERQLKASIGKGKAEFELLKKDFETFYIEKYGQSYEVYIEENVTEPPKLQNLEAALFFVLFQLKNGLTWDVLGAVFEMSGSTAHTNFKVFSKLLEQTLEKKSTAQKEV